MKTRPRALVRVVENFSSRYPGACPEKLGTATSLRLRTRPIVEGSRCAPTRHHSVFVQSEIGAHSINTCHCPCRQTAEASIARRRRATNRSAHSLCRSSFEHEQ